jgi:kynureninase
VAEAGIDAIRRKSLELTGYLRAIVESELPEFDFATPREDHRRGGHLALVHPEASRICKALLADGVIPDHRPPDIVRMAPVALYTRFEDCRIAIDRLRSIMDRRSHEDYPIDRGLIT